MALIPKRYSAIDIASNGQLQGIIKYSDLLHPESREVITALSTVEGVEIHMLTGDNKRTATAVAAGLGILPMHTHAEAFPEQKATVVRLLLIQKLHTPLLNRIMVSITFLGNPLVMLISSLGLAISPLYYNRRWQATILGIAGVGATLLNCLMKILFSRAQPALWKHIINVGQHSFPSGHAMVSIVIYGFTGYILAKQFPEWRFWIYGLTIILIAAVGFSRLYLGVHWLTDVTAGYAAGLVWLITCILSLESQQKYGSLQAG
ncbi:phosphatase PAP2 family protein [Nostoc sp. CHAB 5824]|nr:phosphatase PAP2 family protein [Nostoc sp. CHAB 5824]